MLNLPGVVSFIYLCSFNQELSPDILKTEARGFTLIIKLYMCVLVLIMGTFQSISFGIDLFYELSFTVFGSISNGL